MQIYLSKFLSFCLLIVLFFSCGSDDPNHLLQEEMTDKIWVVHDEVMPKTSEINRIQRQLRKLTKDKELAPDDPVLDMLGRLENAHEGMMEWMKAFKKPSKLRGEKSHEEIMAYLAEQMVEIQEVKNDMLSSINDGQSMVDSFTKAE